MNTNEKEPTRADTTPVDLGSDLLKAGTATSIPWDPLSETDVEINESSVALDEDDEELLRNAKILLGENLVEDAKKVLRRVLLHDLKNARARALLNEVHELELKQILGDGQISRIPSNFMQQDLGAKVDSEEVMRKLDKDLSLGIFSEQGVFRSNNPLALFEDESLMEDFYKKVEIQMGDTSVQDWVDLGIGFLEMDFFYVANKLFLTAYNRAKYADEEDTKQLTSITCLLALSFLLLGQPLDALGKLDAAVRNHSLKREDKVELYYLMARGYQALNKKEIALQFYRQVKDIDPTYRDIENILTKKFG